MISRFLGSTVEFLLLPTHLQHTTIITTTTTALSQLLKCYTACIKTFGVNFEKTLDRKKVDKAVHDFPGGPGVKNLPANAEDTGSVPGAGRLHTPRSNQAHEPQWLSPHVPCGPWPTTREATTTRSPHTASRETLVCSNKDPARPKVNKGNKTKQKSRTKNSQVSFTDVPQMLTFYSILSFSKHTHTHTHKGYSITAHWPI